jgi:hypothetical protein
MAKPMQADRSDFRARMAVPNPTRRGFLHGGAVAAALAILSACTGLTSPRPSRRASPSLPSSGATSSGTVANVRVTTDRYREHVGPSVACNPLNPSQLIVACQASPVVPEMIVTYVSADGGATWSSGGHPPQPAAGPAGDDVTVAYDVHGRAYICATRSGYGNLVTRSNPDANRAIYVWRTDDGGRTYSKPVTVVEGIYCDHPWLSSGGVTASDHDVYVVWGAGASHTAVELARSADGGGSFGTPRRILPEASVASLVSAGPQVSGGTSGLVCVLCDWWTTRAASGDLIGQVVAVCSTDGGRSFGSPVQLGPESAMISLPGGAMANSGPAVVCSPSGDAIYAAFTRHRPGTSSSAIVVSVSRNRGRTWTPATPVTPNDGRIYFQPNLTLDTQGQLAMSAFAMSQGRINEVLLIAPPRSLTFAAPVQVTTSAFDPKDSTTASSGKYGAWWIGDWQGLTSSPGAFHVVWNDTRTGKLDLYAASVRP